MKLFAAAVMALILAACQTPSVPKEVPTVPGAETPAEQPTPVPTPTPAPEVETPQDTAAAVAKIKAITETSACSNYSWKNRGRPASKAYYTGVAVTFARSLCMPDREDVVAASAARKLPESVWDWGDALSLYNSNYAAMGLNNDKAGPDTLTNLYTLIYGSGMQESSGKYCEGRDANATNTSSETAEAGLYQFSYNVRTYYATKADYSADKLTVNDPVMVNLYKKYKADKSKCYLDVYSKGFTCKPHNWKNWGTGEGVVFQQLAKECPAFATELHAVTLRRNVKHFGPTKNKQSEVRPECHKMLTEVRKLVQEDPAICKSL